MWKNFICFCALPGISAYLDFTNPVVRNWYADKHGLDQYKVIIQKIILMLILVTKG